MKKQRSNALKGLYNAPFLLIAAAAAFLLSINPLVARDAPLCGPRDEILKTIYDARGESVVHRGLDAGGAMMEFTLNSTAETWSVIATGSNGQSCVVTHGEAWRDVVPPSNDPQA